MIGFLLGISLTINLITFIGLIIIYKKFFKDNPLSIFYKAPKEVKTKKNKDADDIIKKLMNEEMEMENWDL